MRRLLILVQSLLSEANVDVNMVAKAGWNIARVSGRK